MSLHVETGNFLRGLEMLEAGIFQAVGFAMRDAIRATEASGKQSQSFKDKTGGTRASIRGVYEGARTGSVTFGGASRLLNSGTRAHPIVGRPTLRFMVNGATFYRHMVRHPGTKATHFVEEARNRGEQVLMFGAEYYVGEAIRRAH